MRDMPSLPLLYGARWLAGGDGRPTRWHFDPDHPPRLLVGRLPPLTLVFHDDDGGLRPMACEATEVDGITRLVTRGCRDTGTGSLVVQAGGESCGAWPVELRAVEQVDRLAAPRRLRAEQAFRGALDALDRVEAQGALAGVALLDALELRARLHRDLGELAEAGAAWDEGADLARALDLPTEAARRLRAAAFLALIRRRFVDAEALAERARAALGGCGYLPELLRADYLDGLLADARCDYLRALACLERAHRAAVLLDDPHRAAVAVRLAVVEVNLGRVDRARALCVAAGEPVNLHDRVAHRLERAWFACHAHLAGEAGALIEARRWVERARAEIPVEADRRVAGRCALAAAWVALLDGRVADARSAHDECRALTSGVGPAARDDDYGEPSRALLEGRLLLAEGSPAHARGVFEQVVHMVRARQAGLPSPLVRSALHGVGRAWLAEGDDDAALATWGRALAEVDRAVLDIGRARLPASVAAVTLWGATTGLVDDVVDLLVERDPRAAFAVVDADFVRRRRAVDAEACLAQLDGAARAQWLWRLRTLDRRLAEYGEARADWATEAGTRSAFEGRCRARVQVAFDDAMALLDRGGTAPGPQCALDRLGADEALLAARPRADGSAEVWWLYRGAIHRFVERSLDAVVSERLGDVGHLYVITGGHAPAWSLPVTEVGGAPLAARVSLSFVPQADHIGRRAAPREGRPVALVDPERDLPHARADGAWLREHLDAAVWSGPAVTREAWRAALDAPALHFSGHGELDPDGVAVLRLAGQQAVRAEDLAGRRAPARVVLVGCGTGAAFGDGAINLPIAFLLAGACSVLATTEPIDDAEASRFVRRFYRAGGLRAPGAALRAAVEAAIEAGEAVWRAFRLVGAR